MEIVHDETGSCYRLVDGDATLSHADYRRTVRDGSEVLVFHHTYTQPAHRDNGLAERVVRFALDDARARHAKVVATCWFVADFLRDHQEYADLVA
jgi:predicted GNAT family acetyltransferase